MKNVIKLVANGVILSMIFTSGVAVAQVVGDPDVEIAGNLTVDKRMYQHDGYGAQWALDTGSDGLWFVPQEPVDGTYSAPLKVRNNANANTLVIGTNDDQNITNGYVGIGTDTPTAELDVNGVINGGFSGSDTANNHNVLTIDSNNTGDGASDVGFSLENTESDFKWAFRTYDPEEGFAASKIGTGGTEFEVGNIGTTTATTVVKIGGVTVFEGGALVTSSSRALKDNIEPLDTKAAMDAFHKLQPVSYVYKTDTNNPVVGFIAEDVPELVAMPSHKTFNASEIVAVLTSVVKDQEKSLAETRAEMEIMRAEIAELKGMK